MEKPRILLVDDTPANLKVLSDILRDEFTLSIATNGKAALDIAQNPATRPELVLLDVMMPEMDGYEVCRRLKSDEGTRDVPVIFVTAAAEVDDEERGFRLGAMDYIAKPVSPPIVKSRVRSAISLRRKTIELEALSGKLSRYLSPQIYKSIFEGNTQATVGSKRKKLTIFFSDIVGFTAATERMEPEDISNLLNSYLERMSAICNKHGGTIDKFIGDAILIFYGDPSTRGEAEDALACVSMALEMREALAELRKQWYSMGIEVPFQARTGINTGFCTVGNFGSNERIDYTIIGSQVNIAARLEAAADPGRILLSYETYSLVKDRVHCVRMRPQSVKGILHPLANFEAVDFLVDAPAAQDAPDAVGSLVETSEPVAPDSKLRELAHRLGDNPCSSAVVMEDDAIVGLVRNASLLVLRSCSTDGSWPEHLVREVMQERALVVDASAKVAKVAELAALRPAGQELDPVVVTRGESYAGIVPVRSLLARLAGGRAECATG